MSLPTVAPAGSHQAGGGQEEANKGDSHVCGEDLETEEAVRTLICSTCQASKWCCPLSLTGIFLLDLRTLAGELRGGQDQLVKQGHVVGGTEWPVSTAIGRWLLASCALRDPRDTAALDFVMRTKCSPS